MRLREDATPAWIIDALRRERERADERTMGHQPRLDAPGTSPGPQTPEPPRNGRPEEAHEGGTVVVIPL